jgi:hypothetical protein
MPNALFQQAGFSADKASWLSGLCNTFGILSTAASVLTVDRFGRRKSLYFDFFFQGAVLLLSGGLPRLGELHLATQLRMVRLRLCTCSYTRSFRADGSDNRSHLPGDLATRDARIREQPRCLWLGCWLRNNDIGHSLGVLLARLENSNCVWRFQFCPLPLAFFFFPETKGRNGRDQTALLIKQSNCKRERKGIQENVRRRGRARCGG